MIGVVVGVVVGKVIKRIVVGPVTGFGYAGKSLKLWGAVAGTGAAVVGEKALTRRSSPRKKRPLKLPHSRICLIGVS